MNRDAKIILNIVGKKEYEKLIQNGFRPEDMTPAETVFCLKEEGIGEEDGRNYKEAYSEEACAEIEEFMEIARELESIGDGTCEAILRNAVVPSVENLYKLRYEKESIPEKGKNMHSENALAWAFPEEDKESAEDFLRRIEMEIDEMSLAEASWLMEKEIFLSRTNMEILRELWTLNLPLSEEEAYAFACHSIRRGEIPKEGFFTQALQMLYEDSGQENRIRPESMGKNKNDAPALSYEEYRNGIRIAGEEEELLRKYHIPATPRFANAFRRIRKGNRNEFHAALYKRTFLPEEDVKTQTELLGLLEESGYLEIAYVWGKEVFCVRIREEGKGAAVASIHDTSFGGIFLRIDAGCAIAVVQKEETLSYLKESRILEKRTERLLKSAPERIVYLLKEEYKYEVDLLL